MLTIMAKKQPLCFGQIPSPELVDQFHTIPMTMGEDLKKIQKLTSEQYLTFLGLDPWAVGEPDPTDLKNVVNFYKSQFRRYLKDSDLLNTIHVPTASYRGAGQPILLFPVFDDIDCFMQSNRARVSDHWFIVKVPFNTHWNTYIKNNIPSSSRVYDENHRLWAFNGKHAKIVKYSQEIHFPGWTGFGPSGFFIVPDINVPTASV
jgi:hypothetical protein